MPLWNKCPGIFPNNPPVCLSVCGTVLISGENGKHLSVCLSVCLSGYLLLIAVFIEEDGGAATFDVDRYRLIQVWVERGTGQETWDFVMTAKVLTLGDTGETWHYPLTAR